MSLWLPMGQLVRLLGLEMKCGALVVSVITLVIHAMLLDQGKGSWCTWWGIKMRLWLPMGQLVHLLGLEIKFGALVELVITLVIHGLMFGPKVCLLVHLVGGQDEIVAPNGAVGAPAGAGDEVWGPGGVGDHSGRP